MVATKVTSKLRFRDRVCQFWFFLDGFTHLTLELTYLYFAFTTTARESDSIFAYTWKEYAKADKRWDVYDVNVVSLEILTVFIGGPMALWLVWAIQKRHPSRHIVQLALSVMELYGGWMTFAPEWFSHPIGSPNLVTNDPILLWIYLVFMNVTVGLWVVIPIVLIADSWAILHRSIVRAKAEQPDGVHLDELPSWVYVGCAVLLVVYIIAVPLILATMQV